MTSNRELRALLREDTRKFIVALARNFHSLRSWKLEPWDALAFRSMIPGRSHGEKCAARFVLAVWNTGTDWDDPQLVAEWVKETGASEQTLGWDPLTMKVGKFDVVDALGVWDDDNRAAFIEWAKDPIWP